MRSDTGFDPLFAVLDPLFGASGRLSALRVGSRRWLLSLGFLSFSYSFAIFFLNVLINI